MDLKFEIDAWQPFLKFYKYFSNLLKMPELKRLRLEHINTVLHLAWFSTNSDRIVCQGQLLFLKSKKSKICLLQMPI